MIQAIARCLGYKWTVTFYFHDIVAGDGFSYDHELYRYSYRDYLIDIGLFSITN